jgi:potassium voltage-gated channel Eag-related subfamily H protein 7
MLKIVAVVFFMVHLMSCCWYLSASFYDFDDTTWVFRRGIQDRETSYLYLTSVYWATQTVTTVGYGDIPAKNVIELILSNLWMVFGITFFTFTIGNLASVLENIDTKSAILKH